MPEFYTWAILLINQLGEIGENQLSVFSSRGGQICLLMQVPLSCSAELAHSPYFLAHLSHWLMVSYCDCCMSVVRRQQLLQRTSPPKRLAGFDQTL